MNDAYGQLFALRSVVLVMMLYLWIFFLEAEPRAEKED